MAQPKTRKPKPLGKGRAPVLSKATGFRTGATSIKKANKYSAKLPVHAPRGTKTTRLPAKPKGRDPMDLGALKAIPEFIGNAVNTLQGKGKTLVPKVNTGRPAVLPYVDRQRGKIKKAGK